jgi:AGZA family xanthine/uracil permease-like MFS transporter
MQAIRNFFELEANNTTIGREALAGITTFLTMSYIIFVQPAILGTTGMDRGAVMVATCAASAFATLLMGLLAKYPIALAPAMGHNAFFAFVVCAPAVAGGMGYTWQQGLAAVMVSGLAFMAFSFIGLREALIRAVPECLKYGIAAGIGLLIAIIGLEYGALIMMSSPTLVKMGDLSSTPALLTLLGLAVTGILLVRHVRGAIVIGMVVTAVAALLTGTIEYHGLFAAPPSVAPTAFKLDFAGLFQGTGVIGVIFIFFFLDLFDTVGTLVGVSSQAGFLRKDGSLPRAKQALFSDAAGTVVGAALGTSTVTSYIESSAGVAAGGRTGLCNVFTAILFLLALFFSPLMEMFASAVMVDYTVYFSPAFPAVKHTMSHYPVLAPVLLVVGAFMMSGIKNIPWNDMSEAIPAYLAMIIMPLSFSITEGIAFGFIAYTVLKVAKGQGRQVHWIIYAVSALFILRYIWLGT